MNWVTVIWSVSAGASLTLGMLHLLIWFKSRAAGAHLAFACAAVAVTGVAFCEMQLMQAASPADFARNLRWAHGPFLVLTLGLVCFVGLYFRTGRAWLGWAAAGARLLATAVNFSVPVSLHYREILALETVEFLGQPVSVVASGILNPLRWLGALSSLLLVLYVLDASIRLWRRGGPVNRRRAMVIGGAIVGFVVVATAHVLLVNARVIPGPYFVSFPFLGIVAVMAYELSQDVISSARLAKELHENQQQITLAATAANLALWTWDIAGKRIWVTAEGRSLYGISAGGDVTEERFFTALHPEDRERVRLALHRSRNGDGPFTADYRILLPDGMLRWIASQGSTELNGKKQPVLMRGISRDITARRQAEERSSLIVEAAPNAMIMVDGADRIVLLNRQAELTFGYSREELLGQPIEVLIPQRFSAGHVALSGGFITKPDRRVMGAGRDLFGRRKDGTEVPVEVGLNPLDTSEGRFVLASIIDITERRREEQDALERQTQLTHLSRVSALGQLSGSLAHELNQPLGIILSNAQAAQRMLEQESPDIAELREILADIVSEDRRAGEVIKRLRTLLKRGETRLLPVSLNEIIEEVLRLLRSELIGRSVTVRTELAPGLPNVTGDEVQLQQVLLNIINNACDAMVENPPPERILRISTVRHENTIRVSLADQGCGLPDGDADRVFQPFVTTKSHGMGIGLSICRTIVAAHHGRLWAEPNPGPGTTFHLELQITRTPAS